MFIYGVRFAIYEHTIYIYIFLIKVHIIMANQTYYQNYVQTVHRVYFSKLLFKSRANVYSFVFLYMCLV